MNQQSKNSDGKTTYYVNQFYDIEDGEAKNHIYAGGNKVATFSSGSLVYHHTDHLSGSSIETDENGDLIELLDYYPYGDVRLDEQVGDYENDYKYTGKELDNETDLYYYEARYYDAKIGRFTGIDPWFGDLSDPQSLNKYAYVMNNPLKYVDPTGEAFFPADFQKYFNQFISDLGSGYQGVKSNVRNESSRTFWRAGAENYLKPKGYNISADMLEHSLQDNPSNKYYGNNSSIVGAIKASSEYNDLLSNALSYAEKNNMNAINVPLEGGESLKFSNGDLGLSIHGTHSTTITGTKNDNGDWDINVKIHDYYDFKNEEYYEDLSATMATVNNMADADQGKGINNYDVEIDFTDKRKTEE